MLCLGPVYAQQVTGLELCRAVKDNEPVDPTRAFELREQVFCWVKVEEARPGDHIEVRWWWEEELQHEEKLWLGDQSWRTHCYKTLYWPGQWRAEVYSSQGELLKEITFFTHDTTDQPLEIAREPLPEPTVGAGMPQPAPLGQERGAPATLAASQWLRPNSFPASAAVATWVVMPDEASTAAALWQRLEAEIPDSISAAPTQVMLPANYARYPHGDWAAFSIQLDQFERRILYDLEQADTKDQPVFLLAQGQGADLAWAMMQRYPDRFDGALLVGCECGYYQRGSMPIQAQRGLRYVFAAPGVNQTFELDQLQASLDQLSRAMVPYQALRQADFTQLSNLSASQWLEAMRYLSTVISEQ